MPSQAKPAAGPSTRSLVDSPVEDHDSDFHSDQPDDEFDPQGLDLEGFSSEKIVKPLTAEALAAFQATQEKAGIIYISRIPPGMQPPKIRHLMSGYGQIGRIYLQQEDPKRAYLRKKFTSTKKPHFTEGWVEFMDKKIARSVAEMLNAQPIGGKKGSRWRDDVWTMKYLPKFKWNMLTEQVAHEAQLHQAKLRVELSQSRAEQQEYMRNVDLAKQLEKRAEKKKAKGEVFQLKERPLKRRLEKQDESRNKKQKNNSLDGVLGNIF